MNILYFWTDEGIQIDWFLGKVLRFLSLFDLVLRLNRWCLQKVEDRGREPWRRHALLISIYLPYTSQVSYNVHNTHCELYTISLYTVCIPHINPYTCQVLYIAHIRSKLHTFTVHCTLYCLHCELFFIHTGGDKHSSSGAYTEGCFKRRASPTHSATPDFEVPQPCWF